MNILSACWNILWRTFDSDEDSDVSVTEIIRYRTQVVELVGTIKILNTKYSVL